MGLSVSHSCWSSSYSSFNEWRKAIIAAAGIDTPDYNSYEWPNFQGMWQDEPDDALLILLVHSDCDGFLFPWQLGRIAKRLEDVLPNVSADEEGWLIRATQQFIAGLHHACERESDGAWYGQDVVEFR